MRHSAWPGLCCSAAVCLPSSLAQWHCVHRVSGAPSPVTDFRTPEGSPSRPHKVGNHEEPPPHLSPLLLLPLSSPHHRRLRPQRPQGFILPCMWLCPAAAKASSGTRHLHILLAPPGTVFRALMALLPALAVLSTPKDPPLRDLTCPDDH